MGWKSKAAKWLAAKEISRRSKILDNALGSQLVLRDYLILNGSKTSYGMNQGLEKIKTYEDWKARVPVVEYDGLEHYIQRIKAGAKDVLWPGKPQYLAKTSGTTSGAKYIPITKKTMPFHIRSARSALLSYVHETGNADFVDGKMIFLQGSPDTQVEHGIRIGRLSGITAHHVPSYLQRNRLPSSAVNRIADWEEKVDAIVKETVGEDLRLISGIPSWVQMYFERLLDYTGKRCVKDIFPNFSLFVYGGVNYEPYAGLFERLIGERIPSIELYPASEGFIAYQDSQEKEGLLLEVDSGMFYEFIPLSEYGRENPTRIWLEQVTIGVDYVLIINSAAGLWGYNIGDTVRFVSLEPHRLIVTGRVKHFTSAFGEHVIAEEVERAMSEVSRTLGIEVREFHVAPQVEPKEGLPYHEWFIESQSVLPVEEVASRLDELMCQQNPYYKDLIKGKVLRPLRLTRIRRGGFEEMMRRRGKLGGQNKPPRLANDRSIADYLDDSIMAVEDDQ